MLRASVAGTGKTTWVARQIRHALDKYEPHEIAACSFTRAAAVELAGRDTGLPKRNVGTIHSLCYHHLGQPMIIDGDRELAAEWNERYPQWPMDAKRNVLDEAPERADELMAWNRARACLQPAGPNLWFTEHWEAFKAEHEALDFTDLLIQGPKRLPGVKVLFTDEAQDLSMLQWQLVRSWGEACETFVVVGDDDQMLYCWLGADASTFLAPLLDSQKRTLHQSYRLPRAVWERAESWIAKLGNRREPKTYEPRGEQGEVVESGYMLAYPDRLVSELEDRAEAGETVMVLASCAYMLYPLLGELRARGVPFHNPYRRGRGDWNPVTRTGARLLAFIESCERGLTEPSLPAPLLWQWLEIMQASKTLARGGKTELRRQAKSDNPQPFGDDEFAQWILPDTMNAMRAKDLDWFVENSLKPKSLAYPVEVLKRRGPEALRQKPKIVVGTYHSVKGGEADSVFLAPDISYAEKQELRTRHEQAHDAQVRKFYVGMTRARESLFLCSPSSKWFVNW